MMRFLALVLAIVALAVADPAAVTADGTWLDQNPLMQWNEPGMALPTVEGEDGEVLGLRCSSTARPPETEEDRAVAESGWFLMNGYTAGWGVRVVGGTSSYGGMCRPFDYQYFVFVDEAFAGTLSPETMSSIRDGAVVYTSILAPNLLSVEFDRFAAGDAFCCPSGRSVAFYRIERTDAGPVVLLSSVFSQRLVPRWAARTSATSTA